jgi:CheY-like chemotaxis protein
VRSSLFSAPRPTHEEVAAEVAPEPAAEVPVPATVGAPAGGIPTFGAVVVTVGGTARLVEPQTARTASTPIAPTTVASTSTVRSPSVGDGGASRTPGPPASPPPTPMGGTPPAPGPSPDGPLLRVLLVEDDPGDAALLLALVGTGNGTDVRVESTLHSAQETAQEFAPDVVLLDLDLPDSHGLATITRWIFANMPGVVVVTSGDYTDVTEERGREQGVADFLPKSRIGELLDAGDAGAAEVRQLLMTVTGRA